MKIREVTAKNFRTLEDLKVNFIDSYCTLSGRNNSGKTAVVSIIRHFLDEDERQYWFSENTVSFSRDHTQWCSNETMEISIQLELHRHNDAEVFFVTEKYSPENIQGDVARVRLMEKFSSNGERELTCKVNGHLLAGPHASEVAKKFKSAPNLVVHNSTVPSRNFYILSGEMTEVLESHFSDEDRRKISDAEKRLSNTVKKAAKQHKEDLGQLLGRLGENYEVELTTLNQRSSSRFPLNIKLNDKSVDVNLGGWGSGTQNRTRVLISVMEADRIRKAKQAENRSEPVVIIEEPESFLHPSAQAEFGKILNGLASDFSIQILATTHSPYMLNQSKSEANILLERKVIRNRIKQTELVDTSGDEWMLPFADNLGVLSTEFIPWEKLIKGSNTAVILVEGKIDQDYFRILKEKYPAIYNLPDDIEIVAYGGKDALKNTQVLQFIISRLDKVIITFDLDAKNDICKQLQSIGLHEGQNYLPIGVNKPGLECIEGLLPEKLRASVYSSNPDTVAALNAQSSADKKSAKSKLKQLMLREFEEKKYDSTELQGFKALLNSISKVMT